MKPAILILIALIMGGVVFGYAQRGDPADLTAYASTLIREERIDEAFVQLKKALEADSGYAPAHLLLGDLYYARNNYPQAIEHYKRSLSGAGLNRSQIDRAKSRLAQIA